MRRASMLLLAAAVATGCASGARPVRQLETLEVMVGGGVNGPGAQFDPEFSAWLRFAPWTYFDLTVGGLVTVPLFEHVAAGGLAEVRTHVPITPKLRLTLDFAAELTRYETEDDGEIWARRFTAMPLLVWTGSPKGSLQPYFGPKLMYLSHMDRVSSAALGSSPGFRRSGAGVYMLGGTIGVETAVDVFTAVGGAIDIGLMVDAERGDLDGMYVSVAGYLGY